MARASKQTPAGREQSPPRLHFAKSDHLILQIRPSSSLARHSGINRFVSAQGTYHHLHHPILASNVGRSDTTISYDD